MAYTGSIDLIAGLRAKNGGDFPLVNAHDVYVNDNLRLDEALDKMEEATWESLSRNDQANGITEILFDPAVFGAGSGTSVVLTAVELTATNSMPTMNQEQTEVVGQAGAGLWSDLVMEVYKKDGTLLAENDRFRLKGEGTLVGGQQRYLLSGQGGTVVAGHVYAARFFATDHDGNEVQVRRPDGTPYVNKDGLVVNANYVAGLGLSLYNAGKSGASQELVSKLYCLFNGANNVNLAPCISVVYKTKTLSDAKARDALVSIARTIDAVEGSGTDGKWTLADCSAAIRSIASVISSALACLAVCVFLSGCVSAPALKAVGPHGYTHFEDMDPDSEVLTYDEVTNLIHEAVSNVKFDLSSFGDITSGGVGLPEYIATTVTNLTGNTMVMTVPDGEGGYRHEFYLLGSEDFAPYATPTEEPLGKRNEGESEAPAGSVPGANFATSEPK